MTTAGSMATGLVFLAYLLVIFILTLISGRFLVKPKSFVAEYFIGGRSMGAWALAMSFAATCASGGTFAGFPSLIYTHGWIMFLWIAGYMVFPVFTMGLMGPRLNTIAHRTGAITVPDVLRDRYGSSALGVFASAAIILFLTVNLIAQFKSGGVILHVLLDDTPGFNTFIVPAFESIPWFRSLSASASGGYVLSLLLFAVITVLYTSYGGFRAVVWTDVLQGIVMFAGVLILLPTILVKAGGLPAVTRNLAEMPASVVIGAQATNNGVEYILRDTGQPGPILVRHDARSEPGGPTIARVSEDGNGNKVLSVALRTDATGAVVATASEVAGAVLADLTAAEWVDVRLWGLVEPIGSGIASVTPEPVALTRPQLTRGPSHHANGSLFHPLGMAISFFFLWPISGAGHPGFLVRLMAFRNTRDLRYSIVTVTFYFALIYIPLVLIFVAARTLIHPAELTGGSDSIMPTVAKRFVHPLLAGLLLAAPFSAVMSTVDSFLLVISSSFVRDIYQRTIHPGVSEKGITRGTYLTTAVVGGVATLLALDPPRFLQDIVVFASSGISATFLTAIFLGLYWKRMSRAGAWAAMLSGFGIVVGCHLPILLERLGLPGGGKAIVPWGLDPFVWGCMVSLALGVLVSRYSAPAEEKWLMTYFSRPRAPQSPN